MSEFKAPTCQLYNFIFRWEDVKKYNGKTAATAAGLKKELGHHLCFRCVNLASLFPHNVEHCLRGDIL